MTDSTNTTVVAAPTERRQETYKHLDESIRPGGLALSQWAALAGATVFAIVFALYLSPLPEKLTLSVGALIAGAPWALSYAVGGFDLSISDGVRAVWRWARGEKHYLPGPGTQPDGYLVHAPEARRPAATTRGQSRPQRLEDAWDL